MEIHEFETDASYDGDWGVWTQESCALCGKRLIVVAPIDALPDFLLCKTCDPLHASTSAPC